MGGQILQRARREPHQRGRLPHDIVRSGRHRATAQPERTPQHREEPRRTPDHDSRQAFRVAPRRGVRLPQPDELADQLELELASQVLPPHADPLPRIAPGEQTVSLPDFLVLDCERVARITPLVLREDEGRRVAGAGPR